MHDDVRSMFAGPTQVGRGERVIDDEREFMLVRNVRDGLDVEDISLRIADSLPVEQFGFRRNGPAEVFRISRIDKMYRNAETLKGQGKLIVGTTVQRTRRHHLITGLQQGGQGHQLGSLPGRCGQPADTAFQGGHALFKRGCRGVGDARVEIAKLVQCEEMGSVFRILEDERCRLVNRHGTRPGGGVGGLPSVQHTCVETKIKFFHTTYPSRFLVTWEHALIPVRRQHSGLQAYNIETIILLTKETAVLNLDTAIHDHFQAGCRGLGRRLFIDHTNLHPEDFGADFKGFANEGYDSVSTPKDIHDIYRLLNIQQGFIALQTEDFVIAGIDWVDRIALTLHMHQGA